MSYLQHGRPKTTDRHVFFRSVSPYNRLGSAVVSACATRYLLQAGFQVPRPGSHTPLSSFVGLFGKLFQLTDDTFRAEPHDFLASDEHVVVLTRVHAQRAGKTLQHGEYSHVGHFRDGKLSEVWIVNVDQYEVYEFLS